MAGDKERRGKRDGEEPRNMPERIHMATEKKNYKKETKRKRKKKQEQHQ